jgi:hypothetical protein
LPVIVEASAVPAKPIPSTPIRKYVAVLRHTLTLPSQEGNRAANPPNTPYLLMLVAPARAACAHRRSGQDCVREPILKKICQAEVI